MRRINTYSAAALIYCALLAMLVSGCGSENKKTGTIYLSLPLTGPLAKRSTDMVHAARLSLEQTNSDTQGTQLNLKVIESTSRTAVAAAAEDPQSLAIVGGMSIQSVRAISRVVSSTALLQIGLAPGPTQSADEAARTGNVIWQLPAAPSQGDALAQYVVAGNHKNVSFFTDRSVFANATEVGFTAGAARAGLPVGRTRISGAGENVVGAGFSEGFVGADDPSNAFSAGPHAMVTAGMTADAYPPAGERFFTSFNKEFGHEPDSFAIYSYEAIGLVLDSIQRAEDAKSVVTRGSVTAQAFKIKNRFGPVGHYDVLPSGRTTLYIFQARGGDAPVGPASLIEAQR